MSEIIVELIGKLENDEEAIALAKDFKSYLQGSNPSRMFGRDASYDYPPNVASSELQHVHILKEGDKKYHIPYAYDRTSDFILVYVRGFKNPNHYYIISILKPPAHTKQALITRLLFFAEIAEDFRKDH